jgi:hypothetical protein
MIAAFCRGSLEAIDAFDRDLAVRVRAAVDPAALIQIESASRLSWLPVELDVELTRAVFATVGVSRAQDIFRRGMIDGLGAPLLRPLRAAAGALFGGSVKDVFGWAPRVWSTIYKDCGVVTLEDRGPASLDMRLTELPAVIVHDANYLLGSAATVEGVLESFKIDGRVDLIGPRLADNSALLRVRWVST